MSNEIATYSMILSKLSLGKSGTECPTKTQILAINSLIVIENASTYGANECVKIDDIRKKVETWNYYLTVSPTSMSFGAGGGSKSFTVSSYKRKVLDGVEQSGDTSVSLKSTTISGTGFSLSGTTVSASANEGTSNRTGTVTITQNESNKTATISLSQSGDTISSYGEWTISVSANPTSVSSSGGTSTITASAKRTVYWASGDVTEETGNPALSTNLGSLSSSSSPSTLTLGENTSTSSRTATIKATHGGKSATCTVTQSGATPSTTYTFSINPYKVNVGSSGGSGSVTISSYKTVGSSTYDVDYSIDSSTLPSWASFNKSTSTFTIQSTTSTTGRTAKVYFDQDESGKRDCAELTQTGYTPPADNYVFTWGDGSTSDISASFPWNFSANGTAANIPVISTKNGSSQSWSVSSKPSWITTSTTSSKVTISASDNSGSARSGSVVLTQEDSGKTLTINVSQDAYVADTYVFIIAPNTYNASYSNASFIPRTVSTKNGSNIGYSLTSGSTDWVVVDTTGKITVEILKNTTSSTRSTTLVFTQNESGKTQSIEITQAGQSLATYVFGFGDSLYRSDTVYCAYEAGTYKNFYPVVSTKNGVSQSYFASQRNTWINGYDSSGVSVQENTSGSDRTGSVILQQRGSGKTLTLTVIQRKKPEEYLEIFNDEVSTTSESVTVNFKSSQPWTCGLTDYDANNPVIVGNTSGGASNTAYVPFTYWKEYRRPRRVTYNIRQTAGQKLTASGSITFN